MARLRSALILVWTLAAAAAAGQGTDLPSVLLPQARTLPAPGWLKEGLRLTYYSAAAVLPGSNECFWRDDRGDWVGRNAEDLGLKYKHGEQPRVGGHGFTQVDVVALDNKAVLSVRSWAFMQGVIGPFPPVACVGLPGTAGDWWVNPKALEGIQPRNTQELAILPMPYTIGDTRYDTVRFQSTTPSGSVGWNYDLATGILVHSHTSATTHAQPFTWAGDTTTLTQNTFLGRRQLQLPWSRAAAPAWLATVKHFQYDGTFAVKAQGVGPGPAPCRTTVDVTARGRDWLLCTLATDISGPPGSPPNTGKTLFASGAAQIGGLWLPPAAIPGLAQGMVVDKDAFTGAETRVTLNGTLPNGARGVVLREESSGQVTEWTYDADSGVLQAMRQESRILPTVTLVHLSQVN